MHTDTEKTYTHAYPHESDIKKPDTRYSYID